LENRRKGERKAGMNRKIESMKADRKERQE